ncbi:hypothetical protein D3C72_543380 [compost metagenome]
MTWLARLSRTPVLAIDIRALLVHEPLRIATAPLVAPGAAWPFTSTRNAPGSNVKVEGNNV